MSEDRYNPWTSLALRSVVCTAVSAPIAYWMGPAVALPTAALWGVLLAKPLFDVSASLVQQVRARSYAGVEGVYYQHAGRRVEVIEDDDARWLRASTVQQLLGDRAREAVFAHRFGPGGSRCEDRQRWFVRDEALIDYLEDSDSIDPRRNALRLFVLRDVLNPHRHRRRRSTRN